MAGLGFRDARRQYRRADPWLSAVVGWWRVESLAVLDSVLARARPPGREPRAASREPR